MDETDIEIVFEDLPPRRGGRTAKADPKDLKFAQVLRDNPLRSARFLTLPNYVENRVEKAGAVVNRINSAKHPAFRSGDFRANQRTVEDGTTIVYVTHVPLDR